MDLADAGVKSRDLVWIVHEARQLTRIVGASRRTAAKALRIGQGTDAP